MSTETCSVLVYWDTIATTIGQIINAIGGVDLSADPYNYVSDVVGTDNLIMMDVAWNLNPAPAGVISDMSMAVAFVNYFDDYTNIHLSAMAPVGVFSTYVPDKQFDRIRQISKDQMRWFVYWSLSAYADSLDSEGETEDAKAVRKLMTKSGTRSIVDEMMTALVAAGRSG